MYIVIQGLSDLHEPTAHQRLGGPIIVVCACVCVCVRVAPFCMHAAMSEEKRIGEGKAFAWDEFSAESFMT